MNEHTGRHRSPAAYQDVLDAAPHMWPSSSRARSIFTHGRHCPMLSSGRRSASSLAGRSRRDVVARWLVDHRRTRAAPDVLVPDLAGWRRERMPEFPDAPWSDLVPDWVCEVPSPGTRGFDLTDKRRLYAKNGLAHLWLIDPKPRTLEAFALQGGSWVLVAALRNDDEARVPPFEAISFPLSALWPD